MKHWFNFRGHDSRDMGAYLESMPLLHRPRHRVTSVTVPGRAGSLTIEESDEAYDSYVQSFTVNVRMEKAQELINALAGEGWLTLSNDPHRKQLARVINDFTLKRISPHLDWLTGTVAFTCQPFKYSAAETVETYEDGDYITNDGAVCEKPVITLYGRGTLSLNDFSVEGVTGGCVIDCDTCEVTDLDGNLITARSTGEFPTIPTGQSVIWLSGAESCTIKRAVRYL